MAIPTSAPHAIRVGPAGWSYKDWEGIVYPPGHGSKFDHLAYLASYVDTIEVNSSFYRIPPPTHAKSWVRRVADNDAFRFTVKLYRGFTHEDDVIDSDVDAFRRFLDPLAEAGRLGALLLQYPWSFKATPDSIERVVQTARMFDAYPRVVEVRHSSLQTAEFLDLLDAERLGFANIDQPLFSDSVEPSAVATGPVSYIRLHGRNYQKWFAHEESWERYDYLYSAAELKPWVERAEILGKKQDVYVIGNNHFRGQALVNAAEFKQALGQPAPVPPTLAAAYPDRLSPA